jgi:nucleotide-binding universal stress UspA family protein
VVSLQDLTDLVTGVLAAEVVRSADEQKVDLIILGTHGKKE